MLCRDPRKRASINELLAHPWLKLADIEEDKDIAETEAARAAHNMPELVVARCAAWWDSQGDWLQVGKVQGSWVGDRGD